MGLSFCGVSKDLPELMNSVAVQMLTPMITIIRTKILKSPSTPQYVKDAANLEILPVRITMQISSAKHCKYTMEKFLCCMNYYDHCQ